MCKSSSVSYYVICRLSRPYAYAYHSLHQVLFSELYGKTRAASTHCIGHYAYIGSQSETLKGRFCRHKNLADTRLSLELWRQSGSEFDVIRPPVIPRPHGSGVVCRWATRQTDNGNGDKASRRSDLVVEELGQPRRPRSPV